VRLRSKPLALAIIPLLGLGIVAVIGFRAQNAAVETAGNAGETLELARAVNGAVLAIGDERLLRLGGQATSEGELAAATDAGLVELETRTAGTAAAGVASEVERLVAASRRAEQTPAVELLSEANTQLLAIGTGTGYPTALTGDAARLDRLMAEALEARELAWMAYLTAGPAGSDGGEANGQARPAEIAAISGAFASSDTTWTLATSLADADEIFASGLSNRAAHSLVILEAAAIDGLAEGDLVLSDDEVIAGLAAFRDEWATVTADHGDYVESLLDDELQVEGNRRLLYASLGLVTLALLVALIVMLRRSGRGHESGSAPGPDGSSGAAVEQITQPQVTDLFVDLGRRNQQLLQRILAQLSQLERDEENPETLAALFQLDNIVTRMRRNAESLLALAGATTARQWSEPVSIESTVRAAFGEVEGYQRIAVGELSPVMVRGAVVADITHLLAELLENALKFSDPDTPVAIEGHDRAEGYLVTIADVGIGMSRGVLIENNRRIADPPPLGLVPVKFLGLYVVGRLAERHGITVRLKHGDGGGLVARVHVPRSMLTSDAVPTPGEQPAIGTGRDAPPRRDRKAREEQHSPLEEKSDLDAELAALALPAASETAATEATAEPSPDTVKPARALRPSGRPEPAPATARSSPSPPKPVSESDAGLPVRNRGQALQSGPKPVVARAAETELPAAETSPPAEGSGASETSETSETAADSFSSMMSALSSGISRGIEDSEFEREEDG
jgi:signal transduction histidine kinase